MFACSDVTVDISCYSVCLVCSDDTVDINIFLHLFQYIFASIPLQEVVFAPGENRKNIVIQIINDDLPEPEEQFQVILTTPRNGAMLGQFIRGMLNGRCHTDAAKFDISR